MALGCKAIQRSVYLGWRICCSRAGRYLFFGGCTTLVNLLFFLLFFRVIGWSGWFSNTVAWGPAVLFAWGTNRQWVFDARQGLGVWGLTGEFLTFAASRLFTGALDVLLIYLTVDLARWPDVAMKIGVGVVIVLLNYIVSRWLVFQEGAPL